jgi:hypothetical protein|tara:strand:- start:196 stop:435 length:240 start_codon:yes stop_codon:yes gene_type:complete
MPPDTQQILFYPVDETFRSTSFSLPIVLIAVPFLSILIIYGTMFAAGCFVIVGIERALGRSKYTDKIITFLKKIGTKND